MKILNVLNKIFKTERNEVNEKNTDVYIMFQAKINLFLPTNKALRRFSILVNFLY